MEDHHDDCGDDLISLNDNTEALLIKEPTMLPCDFDTDDALSDEDHNYCRRLRLGDKLNVYPVDLFKGC